MPDKYVPFKFNILPPPPKQELELIEEREESILYAFLLIFFAALVYLGLVVGEGVLVDTRLRSLDQALQDRSATVGSFDEARLLNGELFTKARSLQGVLEKKLDPAEIFRVGSEIAQVSGAAIESYGRERSGLFVFLVLTPNFETVDEAVRAARSVQGVSGVSVRNSVLDDENNIVRTTLTLNISGAQG